MFSRDEAWICFRNKPLLSLDPAVALLSSGCGGTEVRERGDGGVHVRGSVRSVHYHAASHSLTSGEVRILLNASGKASDALLVLTREEDRCRLRVEGLPWDHNRVVFHLLLDASERIYTGGQLYEPDTEPQLLDAGSSFVWAQVRHPFPVNGIHTDHGFCVAMEFGHLTRIGAPKPLRAKPYAVFELSCWTSRGSLLLSREPDAETAGNALRARMAARLALPGPDLFPAWPKWVRGGMEPVMRVARPDGVNGAGVPVLIEDWQGMKQTLLGGMSDCTWQPDIQRYPRFGDFLRTLRAQGVEVTLPVFPFVDMDTEMYREAAVRGYCLVNRNGRIHEDRRRENPAAWLDLTNQKAVAWLGDRLRECADQLDVDGWMAQLDLPYPVEASAAEGDAIRLRNEWAARWYRVCRDAFSAKPALQVFPARAAVRGTRAGHGRKVVAVTRLSK